LTPNTSSSCFSARFQLSRSSWGESVGSSKQKKWWR